MVTLYRKHPDGPLLNIAPAGSGVALVSSPDCCCHTYTTAPTSCLGSTSGPTVIYLRTQLYNHFHWIFGAVPDGVCTGSITCPPGSLHAPSVLCCDLFDGATIAWVNDASGHNFDQIAIYSCASFFGVPHCACNAPFDITNFGASLEWDGGVAGGGPLRWRLTAQMHHCLHPDSAGQLAEYKSGPIPLILDPSITYATAYIAQVQGTWTMNKVPAAVPPGGWMCNFPATTTLSAV